MKIVRRPPALLAAVPGRLLPGVSGIALGPVVLLRRDRFADPALRAHELVHVRQFYRTLGLFPLLYLLWPAYRLRSEIEAYRVQIAMQATRAARLRMAEQAAAMLASGYFLDITPDRAHRLLVG